MVSKNRVKSNKVYLVFMSEHFVTLNLKVENTNTPILI